MIVYPALDLRGGQQVVRLREGDPNQQTTFADDPVAVARQWQSQGAQWLHVVNLDGAFAQANDNGGVLARVAALGVPVQFGGGLRTLADARAAIERGARRVVLGTAAVQTPDLVTEAVRDFGPEAVCVAVDARDGIITTHGWQQSAGVSVQHFGRDMAARGVRHALYTDVRRDGLLTGVDVAGTAELGRATNLRVIASGGVASLDDIARLTATGDVAGVVVGMALYTGVFTLADALATVRTVQAELEQTDAEAAEESQDVG